MRVDLKLEIVGISKPTEDSVSLVFKRAGALAHYRAGQHALLSVVINGEVYRRTYSFHTSPHVDEHAGITVRAVEGGLVSNYLQSAGTSADLRLDGVAGEFEIVPDMNGRRHLVMFAGGSGITPLMSMLKSVLHTEPDSTVSLIYSNKSYSRVIFRAELEALAEQFKGRLTIYHVLTQDAGEVPSGFPVFYMGRLSKLVVKKLIKTILAEGDCPLEYYLCGPFSFMETIEQAISSVTPGSAVHKEHFFIPAAVEDFEPDNLATREVILRTGEEEQLLVVPGGKSILESALARGLKVRYSCTEGQCGTCRAHLVSGEVKLRRNHILTAGELSEGQILLCQGYPLTDGVVVRVG